MNDTALVLCSVLGWSVLAVCLAVACLAGSPLALCGAGAAYAGLLVVGRVDEALRRLEVTREL